MEEKERLVKIETEVQSIKQDIHTLYKKTEEINSINTVIALLTSSINDLKTTVNDLRTTVNSLNSKVDNVSNEPVREKANMWNTIVKYIVTGILALGMGYIGTKLGIKQ
jgi:uncharacterized phage infection (PIP) family protein YhgE